MDGFMEGRNYYFGFQLGAAYKITPDFSVYGGLRLLYGTATYKAKISNIMVNTAGGYVEFGGFLQGAETTIDGGINQINAGIAQYEAAGVPAPAELTAQKAQLEGTKQSLNALQKYSQGVNLLCNQSSVGIAPVIGIDYKIGRFNFAAKYEFKTQIHMKNESTVNEASEIPAVNKFRDGEKIDEDSPAQLAFGAMWSITDDIRLNLGYHHFYDKNVNWYNNAQDLLDGGTNEYLAGIEWDITDKLTVSGGSQLTRYQLSDAYMNDMSFVVNSYSMGFGFSYKASEKVTLKAAYFQTNYSHYDRVTSKEPLVSDSFTRTNRVLGIGCELAL
jgi:long-subunit fatty acid transport protein